MYRFIWIEQAKDRSLYIGNSDPNSNTMGYKKMEWPVGKENEIRYDEINISNKSDKPSKISFHNSGDVHLKSLDGAKHFSFNGRGLSSFEDYRKLLIIRPTKIEKYPQYNKIDSNDVIVDVDFWGSNPFYVQIFLINKKYDNFKLSDSALYQWVILNAMDFNILLLFYHKDEIKDWSPNTMFMVREVK